MSGRQGRRSSLRGQGCLARRGGLLARGHRPRRLPGITPVATSSGMRLFAAVSPLTVAGAAPALRV